MLWIDNLVEILLPHILSHLYELYHPIHISQLLCLRKLLRRHIILVFQVLPYSLNRRNRHRIIRKLDLCSVFFEILLYNRFVLFYRWILEFIQVTFGLFYSIKQPHLCLRAILIIITTKSL